MGIFSRIKARLKKRKERKRRMKLMRRHDSYSEYALLQRQWKNEMIREAMGEGVLLYGWSYDPQFGEARSQRDFILNNRHRVVKRLKKMPAESVAHFLRKWSDDIKKGKAPRYLEVFG